jgi:uncharacterized protein (DUF433 family)
MINKSELLERITVNPKVMVGKPTIRGLRITVEQILDALASGVKEQELIQEFPELETDDIKAAIFYANSLVKQEKVYTIGA